MGNAVRDAGARSSGGIPMQAEASAYFTRIGGAPSTAYRAAVNEFIYRMKAAGIWTPTKACKIFAGPTSAASLMDVVNAALDATITGSLTHTAYKGFTGLTNTNRMNFGVSYSTLFASDSFFSCLVGTVGSGTGDMVTQSTGSNTPGGFNIGSSLIRPGGMTASGVTAGAAGEGFVVGGLAANTGINPASGAFTGAASSGSRGTSLVTGAVATHPIGRLVGHLAMDPGLTNAQYRKASVLFANLFEILDALT